MLNVDGLIALAKRLPGARKPPRRKPELVNLLSSHLRGKGLHELWHCLEEKDRKVIAEAVHKTNGVFDERRFKAKYGNVSLQWPSDPFDSAPTALKLFFYPRSRTAIDPSPTIPQDLMAELTELAPEPEPLSVAVTDDPTKAHSREKEPKSRRARRNAGQSSELERRDTERAAQQDLVAVLNLIEAGQVQVGPKTGTASAASMRTIIDRLSSGDWYEWVPKKQRCEQEIGPVKAYAWPLLAQVAGLAKINGTKLALTPRGRKALGPPPAETLKAIWERWETSSRIDEFNRVEAIRGQSGKGKRTLTDPAVRRDSVLTALAECPADQWIHFDDFSRYARATGCDFEVSRDLWKLYIGDPRYGALGYAGFGEWHVLQERYMLAVLMEYVATMGAIDIIYENPEHARPDVNDIWGTDDLSFLSRYDGLRYFRINPLGEYVLGDTSAYRVTGPVARSYVTVKPDSQVVLEGSKPTYEEELFLDTWGDRESNSVWRLSPEKAVKAIENGREVKELRDFLETRETQPLPEKVDGFLKQIEAHAQACRHKGTRILIECSSREVADTIAGHGEMTGLTLRAGERSLLVHPKDEEAFRKALNSLGYALPYV